MSSSRPCTVTGPGSRRASTDKRGAKAPRSSPEELDRIACDPGRKVYLDAIIECRRCRIKTIDGLLAMLEAKE